MKLYTYFGMIMAATLSVAAHAQLKESTEGCVYKADEINSVLGFSVLPAHGSVIQAAPITMISCTYPGKGLNSFSIAQMRTTAATGILVKDVNMMLAGKMEPVAGDPDGARWQIAQGDSTDVSLDYLRKGVHTQIRVSGVDQKNPAAVASMRSKLLKLRRLP